MWSLPVILSALAMLSSDYVARERSALRQATPLDPIATIVDAFRNHPVVAVDEPHGNEQSHAFRLSLIRDPRFHTIVNDILVEFGNSRYQNVMDRFVGG